METVKGCFFVIASNIKATLAKFISSSKKVLAKKHLSNKENMSVIQITSTFLSGFSLYQN